jgi:hypothetical protein
MSLMLEVHYRSPADPLRERSLTTLVTQLGGRLDYREDPVAIASSAVILTYEFDERERAENAANALREQGEHVEGPADYGS